MLLQLYKFNIPKAAEQADAVAPVAQNERLVVCAALLVGATNNAFIYTRF